MHTTHSDEIAKKDDRHKRASAWRRSDCRIDSIATDDVIQGS